MKRSLVISVRAEADLRAIWSWTYERFGEMQADRYLDELADGIRTCGEAPESGKDRSELRPDHRSRLVGRHVVFYVATDTQVLVQRVLHSSMDFGSRLWE